MIPPPPPVPQRGLFRKRYSINWHVAAFQAGIVYVAGIDPALIDQYVHDSTVASSLRLALVLCVASTNLFHLSRTSNAADPAPTDPAIDPAKGPLT